MPSERTIKERLGYHTLPDQNGHKMQSAGLARDALAEIKKLEAERSDLAHDAERSSGLRETAEKMRDRAVELLAVAGRERDEWRKRAFDLPMEARKSGYEDGVNWERAKHDEFIELLRPVMDSALFWKNKWGQQTCIVCGTGIPGAHDMDTCPVEKVKRLLDPGRQARQEGEVKDA